MKRLMWIPALAAFSLFALAWLPFHALEVRSGSGKIVFMTAVEPGDTFTFTFVHSVEKSKVTDFFRIDDRYRIILYQSEFSSLNTGLPAVVSEGEIFERTGNGFRLSGLRRVLPEILQWVHEDFGGSLSVGGRVISLPGLAGNGLARISIRNVFAWELIFRALGI